MTILQRLFLVMASILTVISFTVVLINPLYAEIAQHVECLGEKMSAIIEQTVTQSFCATNILSDE